MNNTPMTGCEGCKTTGGRMSCYIHGRNMFSISTNIAKVEYGYGSKLRCPKHDELIACPICCEEDATEISHILHKNL